MAIRARARASLFTTESMAAGHISTYRRLVHEWNDPQLVKRVGEHRAQDGNYALFSHDTHRRMVTEPTSMARYDLSNYDGVLAHGGVLRDLYEAQGRARRAGTWHEAADIRVFLPLPKQPLDGDLVWVGNWGNNERTAELQEFLINPCKQLRLATNVCGVRYPRHATERRVLSEHTYRHRVDLLESVLDAARHPKRKRASKALVGAASGATAA